MSEKHENTARWGGPGASKEDRNRPAEVRKGQPDEDTRRRSAVSGGGGERDSHHSRDPHDKGDKGGPGR